MYATAIKHKTEQGIKLPKLKEFFKNRKVSFEILDLILEAHKVNELIKKADVVFGEVPWEAGTKKFYEVKGEEPQKHLDLIKSIYKLVLNNQSKPFYLICSKKTAKALHVVLPYQYELRLNDHTGMLVTNQQDWEEKESNVEVLEDLGNRFNCIYDFCCGYGNCAYHFMKQRETNRAILSDLNSYFNEVWQEG